MSRLIKIQSDNNGPYDASNRFIRLTIPESTTAYNFDESFILCDSHASTANNRTLLRWQFSPYSKVKAVKVMSQKRGQIGFTQYYDILMTNLIHLVESEEDWNAPTYLNENGSAWQSEQFRLKLKKLHPFFRTKEAKNMTTEYYGDIHIEIEIMIEVNLLAKDTTRVYAPNVTLAAGTLNHLPIGPEKSTLFVGQRVAVERHIGGAAEPDVDTHITAINRANGNYTVVFADDIGADADVLTLVTVRQQALAADTITQPQIDNVEMVLYEALAKPAKQTGKVVYSTYNLQMVPMPATQYFNQYFDLEPMVTNTYLMFPPNGSLLSAEQHLVTYRIALNDEDTTNRDVEFEEGLHYALLSDSLEKSGYKLMRGGHLVVGQPIKPNANYTKYHINLTGSQAMTAKTVYLFTEKVVA